MTGTEPIIEGDINACPVLVSLRDATVTTKKGGRVLLRVADLHVHAGEKLCVMGPSGAGKSMLLALISGRMADTVQLTGTRSAARVTSIGHIPQRGTDAFHPLMTVGKQMAIVTGAHIAQMTDTLSAVGLEARLLNRRPAELSGGQLQRMAIAMGFLGNPDIVLADEPTSALDARSRQETIALFNCLHERTGASLVIATHDVEVPVQLGTGRIDVHSGELTVRSRKFHRVGPLATAQFTNS